MLWHGAPGGATVDPTRESHGEVEACASSGVGGVILSSRMIEAGERDASWRCHCSCAQDSPGVAGSSHVERPARCKDAPPLRSSSLAPLPAASLGATPSGVAHGMPRASQSAEATARTRGGLTALPTCTHRTNSQLREGSLHSRGTPLHRQGREVAWISSVVLMRAWPRGGTTDTHVSTV